MNNDMISREALKKEVRKLILSWNDKTEYGRVRIFSYEYILELIDNAPTALFPLTVRVVDKVTDEDIETIKRLMKDYQPQIINIENEWIPITFRQANEDEYKEFIERFEDIPREECKVYDCRMPDDGQEVLITTSWGAVCEDTYHTDDDLAGFEDHDDPDDVIAWMPKPEAYKKEDAK